MKVSSVVAAAAYLCSVAAQSSPSEKTTTSKSSRLAGTIVDGIWYTDFSLASKRASEISKAYNVVSSIVGANYGDTSSSITAAAAGSSATHNSSSTISAGAVSTALTKKHTAKNKAVRPSYFGACVAKLAILI